MFSSKISSSRSALLPRKELEIFKSFFEMACKATDPEIALVFCDEAEATLSQMKRALKEAELSHTSPDPSLRFDVATAYIKLSKLLQELKHFDKAKVTRSRAEKLG